MTTLKYRCLDDEIRRHEAVPWEQIEEGDVYTWGTCYITFIRGAAHKYWASRRNHNTLVDGPLLNLGKPLT